MVKVINKLVNQIKIHIPIIFILCLLYFIQCQKQYSIKNIKKIYKANTNTNTSAKKAGIAKLISVELDIKKKSINRNKGRYIMIK